MQMLEHDDVAALPARERILETAHRLFYREGIRATGVDAVIAAAGVTKVTFCRHFPSKSELIDAVLTLRHGRWMAWFTSALQRHARCLPLPRALAATLREWLSRPDFRGCAFINAAVEWGGSEPAVLQQAATHKRAMTDAIGAHLPDTPQREALAQALALAVDGCIVQAQIHAGVPREIQASLNALTLLAQALLPENAPGGGNSPDLGEIGPGKPGAGPTSLRR